MPHKCELHHIIWNLLKNQQFVMFFNILGSIWGAHHLLGERRQELLYIVSSPKALCRPSSISEIGKYLAPEPSLLPAKEKCGDASDAKKLAFQFQRNSYFCFFGLGFNQEAIGYFTRSVADAYLQASRRIPVIDGAGCCFLPDIYSKLCASGRGL